MAKKTQGKVLPKRNKRQRIKWTGRNHKPFVGKKSLQRKKEGDKRGKQPDSKLNPSYQHHPREKANSRYLTGNWSKGNKNSGSLLPTKDLKQSTEGTGEQNFSPCDKLPKGLANPKAGKNQKGDKKTLLPCYCRTWPKWGKNQRRGKQILRTT